MTARLVVAVGLLVVGSPAVAAPKGAAPHGGRLTVVADRVDGPLDLGAIAAPIRRAAAGLVACFDDKLIGPGIHDGLLAVSLTIDPVGHASAMADGHGPWEDDADFAACVEARLGHVTFPPAKAASAAVVRLVFVPARAKGGALQLQADQAAALAALLAEPEHPPGSRPGDLLGAQVPTSGTPTSGRNGGGSVGSGLAALTEVPTPRVSFERVVAHGGIKVGDADLRLKQAAARVAGCFRDAGKARRLEVEVVGGDNPPTTTVSGLVEQEQACATRVIGRNVGTLAAGATIQAQLVIRPTTAGR